jgi:SAM-dependent methyltransferase
VLQDLFQGSSWARSFLRAGAALSPLPAETLLHDSRADVYFTRLEARALSVPAQARLRKRPIAPDFWSHAHGSFLVYGRVLALSDPERNTPLPGRILDFGCGTGAQLRALAADPAVKDACGVESSPLFQKLYDQWFKRVGAAPSVWRTGRCRVVGGRFPADSAVVRAVEGPFDLVLAKNVLKRGCLRPGHGLRPHTALGMSSAAFLRTIRGLLRPGGQFAVYNLFPASTASSPWAWPGPPFARRTWKSAGFELLRYEVDDSAVARALARVLRWPAGGGTSAAFTLARRSG